MLLLLLRPLPLAGYLQALEQVFMAALLLAQEPSRAIMGQRLLLAVQLLRQLQILTLRTTLPWRNLTQTPSRCFRFTSIMQICSASMNEVASKVQSWCDKKALQISELWPCVNLVTVLPHLERVAMLAPHAAI